ncbi:PKD domain-containing protein [Candidatus Bipolaricaulota bacterium]|nr:PKD domain-containing protein [Candidatus Bipolaricaulota bacterium]
MRRIGKIGLLALLGLGLAGCAWLFSPLTAVLTATPLSGVAPLSVTFSAAGSSGTIVSFTIDFETDGVVDYTGTDITAGVNHTYTSAGTYTATLTVIDNRGRTATDTVTITVTAPPTTSVSLGALPASGSAPLGVDFWATITAAEGRRIKHIALDYDSDGTPEDEADVDFVSYDWWIGSYEYTDPGTYTATLTVTDDATPPQTFTATATITVTSPPPEITAFTVNGSDVEPVEVVVGTNVTFAFQAQAGDAARKLVRWELRSGDGYVVTRDVAPTSTLDVTHVYAGGYTQTGSYTATVKVWDDLTPAKTDQASLAVEVTAP